MPKEWVLNSVNMRFGLNRKTNVGPTSENIRKCAPKTLQEWQDYYFANVYPSSHLDELGRKLYTKITEVIVAEIAEITEEDCIQFVHNLVINRTFDGYQTEIKTVYGKLQTHLDDLDVKIQPAPDEWDRLYNVDFFIEVEGKFIGLQIKPGADTAHIHQIYTERALQAKTHKAFTKKYGGSVFYIFSVKDGDTKRIHNPEVIEEIRQEVERLKA
ncbi:MAG: hypothetical protein OHK0029_19970 [Armatimonadaceae bacterium]